MNLTAYPTAYTSERCSYNERRGDCNMKKNSSVQLSKEEQKALENTIKIGIYKAMKKEGIITDYQYVELITKEKKHEIL